MQYCVHLFLVFITHIEMNIYILDKLSGFGEG